MTKIRFFPAGGGCGGGGATTALDNLASVAINTSLISDTDSTDDLGSSSISWSSLYVDKVVITADFTGLVQGTSDGSDNRTTIVAGGGTSGSARGGVIFVYGNETGSVGGIDIRTGDESAATIDFQFGAAGTRVISINSTTLLPVTDSLYDSGTSSLFWDETFTDELILTNVGAANAANDKLVLSAVDLSAGNTILDINTEGTGVVGSGTPTADRTVAVRVNGTVLYLIASTAAS